MSAVRIKTWRVKKRYLLFLVAALFICNGVYNLISEKINERNVAALSWAVANKVIVVDPGHGGADGGAVGSTGVEEKEINLAVAKRLATVLGQAGAAVLLTRETDTMLSNPDTAGMMSKKRQDLTMRVRMANESKADLYISVHCNSYRADTSQHGAQTFSQPGSKESKRLGQCLQHELVQVLDKSNKRKAKEVADYFINENTKMPSAIVEIGFITNPKEEKLLLDPAYQSKVAFAIYSGIVKYFAESET